MSKQEQQLADKLDAFLTAKLNGQETTGIADLPPAEARLAAELVEMAQAAVPEADFLVNLEAKLVRNARHAASRKHQSQKIMKPERLNFWQEFTLFVRSVTMKRTLITLGAVVTVLVVGFFALNFLTGGDESGDQVADITPADVVDTTAGSESVEAPEAGESGSAAAVEDAAEAGQPADTGSDNGGTETGTPADPSELAMLPLMEAGQSGGGMAAGGLGGGGGIAEGAPAPAMDMAMMIAPDFATVFSQATYSLNTALPTEPTAAAVSERVYMELTYEMARQIADNLGFTGPIYTEIYDMAIRPMPMPAPTGESVPGEEGEGIAVDRPVEEMDWAPPLQFFAFDGWRTLSISADGFNMYTRKENFDYLQEVPNAIEVAEAFLLEHGLLDFPYEMGGGYNSVDVYVYRVVNGRKLAQPEIYVQVNSSGEVVFFGAHQAFSTMVPRGDYPLISAEAAWQLIQDGVIENNISFQIIPDEEEMMARPMVVEEPAFMPKYWHRERTPGQEAHIYSWFQAYKVAEGEGAPRVEFGPYVLSGSDADLQAIAEQLGNMAHVHGRIAEDNLTLELISWEIIPEPTPLMLEGAVQYSDGMVLFTSIEGETFIVQDAPADLPDGLKVNLFGWHTFDAGLAFPVFDWENIDEWFDYQSEPAIMPLPEPVMSGGEGEYVDPFSFSEIRIDEVSIDYEQTYDYSSFDKRMRPPTFVQPVWVFKGVTDLGDTITLSVQAVAREYLQTP